LVNSNTVKNILLDLKYIADINIKESYNYKEKNYDTVIFCLLDVGTDWVPIVIGIPSNWEISLFDIYLNLIDLPFIPHIDQKGKLCLFELEGLLFDLDFEGLLITCIIKAKNILFNGLNEKNFEDFIKEFDSYLLFLPNLIRAQVSVPKIKKNQNIHYSAKMDSTKKIGESYKDFLRRLLNNTIFASTSSADFDTWDVKYTIRNGIYLCIDLNSYFYPPSYINFCLKDYLNSLLDYVDCKEFKNLIKKDKNEYLLIFEIKQKNNFTNFFGVLLHNAQFKFCDKVELVKYNIIFPISINRIDKGFLMNRTSQEENLLKNKSILLIGCGSIGGYVFNNLIKSGCEDITLVDFDIFGNENIYRHYLGVESVGKNKAEALKDYTKNSLPNLKIKPINSRIELLTENKNSDFCFETYDFVISATGNHNVNRWINKYIFFNKINSPVFYVWNEPLDLGCHVAFIKYTNLGCYNCFFDKTCDENLLYDKFSFSAPNQEFTKSVSGCTGTFIPYGSSISLKSSMLFMDCLKKVIHGEGNINFIVSEKGDDYYFKQAGFKVSKVYQDQLNVIDIIEGKNFFNKNCNICGNK